MVHCQVLVNADQLRGVDAEEFCERVGIEPSWAIEFKKMLKLAQLLKDRGVSLAGSLGGTCTQPSRSLPIAFNPRSNA